MRRGLHGYTHEFVSTLSETQQRDVLAKSIDVVTRFTGKKPKGWTAPAWSTSIETVKLLEEFGLVTTPRSFRKELKKKQKDNEGHIDDFAFSQQEYDHSFMHHDCQLYHLPQVTSGMWIETNTAQPASTWMTPLRGPLQASSIVEVPANWHLDDWPPFQLNLKQGSTHGYVDPDVIEKMWKKQFDFFYREYDSFVFPMSIHPQVSGKPQVVMMHENIIEYINSHEGVEWVTMEQMVAEFKAGRFAGAEVKGGANV